MYLTKTERDRRYALLRERMQNESIDAILVVGAPGVGGRRGSGTFRYLTDFYLIFDYGLFAFFAEGEPVMWATAELTQYWALKHSWISDIRVEHPYAPNVIKVLKERVKNGGRLGLANMESLPAEIYKQLLETLPTWEFTDADNILLDIRFSKSKEEQRLLKTAAEITDDGFLSAIKMIRPGIKAYEVLGALEGFQRGHGADQTFNLISSGAFPQGNGQNFQGLPWYNSDREINKGDVVLLEMTAAYGGYWNQLVRAVSVGAENQVLRNFHQASIKTTQATLDTIKPGVKTANFVSTMEKNAKNEGYRATLPMGHFVGLDLVEFRVEPKVELRLRPGATVILHPCLADERGVRLLWGQTYLISEDATNRLNSTGDELVVVS